MAELMEGGRSKVQADRTLGELADACRESAAELEAFLEVRIRGLPCRGVVTESRSLRCPVFQVCAYSSWGTDCI